MVILDNVDCEFPVRQPRNINSFVKVVLLTTGDDGPNDWFYCYRADVYTLYDVELGSLESYVDAMDVDDVFKNDFLKRFSSKKSSERYRDEYHYWIKFRTLLAGYQLFKKDIEEFKSVLKTAKDEDGFCILAGLS